MGFKTGLLVGLGAGYVLGTRAGTERYEEIKGWWGSLTGSPSVQRIADRGMDVASSAASRSYEAVSTGVEKATDVVKEKLGAADAGDVKGSGKSESSKASSTSGGNGGSSSSTAKTS